MANLKQGTELIAKTALSLKTPGKRGKAVQAKEGDIFIVTSPQYANTESAKIDRKRGALLNLGYDVDLASIAQFFTVAE